MRRRGGNNPIVHLCQTCGKKLPNTRAYYNATECAACSRLKRMPDLSARQFAEEMAGASFCQAGLREEYFYEVLMRFIDSRGR